MVGAMGRLRNYSLKVVGSYAPIKAEARKRSVHAEAVGATGKDEGRHSGLTGSSRLENRWEGRYRAGGISGASSASPVVSDWRQKNAGAAGEMPDKGM